MRRETEEGLKAFRERQKGGGDAPDAGGEDAGVEGEGESWGVGKKRKRVKDREVKGVRRRVSSGEADAETKAAKEPPIKAAESEVKKPEEAAKPPEKKILGLVGYGSDSDDDDD